MNLAQAEGLLKALLGQHIEIDFEDDRTAMLEIPLVRERDVQRIIKSDAEIIGLKPREKVAKRSSPSQEELDQARQNSTVRARNVVGNVRRPGDRQPEQPELNQADEVKR